MPSFVDKLFSSRRKSASERESRPRSGDEAVDVITNSSEAKESRVRSVELEPGYILRFSEEQVADAKRRIREFDAEERASSAQKSR